MLLLFVSKLKANPSKHMRDLGEFNDFPVKKPDKEKCRFQKQRKYVTDSLAETGSPRSGPKPIDTPKKEKDIVIKM